MDFSSRAPLPLIHKQQASVSDAPSWTGTLAQSRSVTVQVPGLAVYDVVSWEGWEGVSAPFHFRLWVRLEKQAPLLGQLVGKPASGVFAPFQAKDSNAFRGSSRFFHGLIARVTEGELSSDGYPLVALDIHPTFWFLSLTRDSRIFSGMSALEIVKKVLNENKVIFEDQTTSAGQRNRDFCVQYQESHFAFVSRLLEEEGIFYLFKHEENAHTLVLVDDNKSCASLGEVAFSSATSGKSFFANRLLRMRRTQDVTANKVTLKDYHFKTPAQKLYVSQGGGEMPLRLYTYPGSFTKLSDGEKLTRQRLEAEECLQVLFDGLSSCPTFSAGKRFVAKGSQAPEFNTEYLLLEVSHRYGFDAQGAEHFHNTFRGIPVDKPFRPREVTPKPVAYQDTAVVVGREQDEIYTNEEGHIKVKFHWDTRDKETVRDEDRSCWMRVASSWAGGGWGMVHIPRVGQEVVVTFLNHNPDCPLVVGSVYNGTHKPPYVADDPTQSGIRSHTTKGGTDETFNEICFRDEKGQEELLVRAEKDATFLVKDALATTVEKGDAVLTLEKGSREVSLKGEGGHLKTSIASGNHELVIEKGNCRVVVEQGASEVDVTGGIYRIKVARGDVEITTTGQIKLKAQGGLSLSTPGKMAIDCGSFSLNAKTTATIAGNVKLSLKGGAQATLEAPVVNVAGSAAAKVTGAVVMLN